MADEALQMVRDRTTRLPDPRDLRVPPSPRCRRSSRATGASDADFSNPPRRHVSSVTAVHSRPRSLTSPPSPLAPRVLPHQVMDAPDAKVDAARDEFCRPYKPANWPEFLRATLGAAAAARLLDASPASPVASPRRRLASPVASPVASPPASPRRGRPSAAALAAPTQPTALDYAALSVVGMMIAVVAAFVAPGGAARFEDGFRQVAAAAAAAGVDAEAIRWVTKVLTVGGTLALSGGVAGAIILAMASVVVYAVFAKAR